MRALISAIVCVLWALSAQAHTPVLPTQAPADGITLAWDANSEPEVLGYRVHIGTASQTYTEGIYVGNVTTFQYQAGTPGVRYYFAVSAYMAGPWEGLRSAEVSAVVAGTPQQPVDCALSAWTITNPNEPWGPCSPPGTQTRGETWQRLIATPPQNGGLACGPLTEARIGTQACTVPMVCGPDASGRQAVKVTVGTWPKSMTAGGLGQVTFSLLQSLRPVVRVLVKFDGVDQGQPLTGDDLRNVAAAYFTASKVRGSYLLTVEAFDAEDCADGGAVRPMTVVVQ